MPVQHIIVEAAIIVGGLLIIACAFKIAAWEEWDDYRRLERRAHLNLLKQSGEWEL